VQTLKGYLLVLAAALAAWGLIDGFLRLMAPPPVPRPPITRQVVLGWDQTSPTPGSVSGAQLSEAMELLLDYPLVQDAALRAGWELHIETGEWGSLLEGMKSGRIQMLLHTADTPERRAWAWFTAPYFAYETGAFTARHAAPRSLDGWVSAIASGQTRLAAIRHSAYPEPVERAMKAPGAQVVWVTDDLQGMQAIASGRADLVLTDMIAGSAFLRSRWELGKALTVSPLALTEQSHVMLSKAAFSEADARTFGVALSEARDSAVGRRILRAAQMPALFALATHYWPLVELGMLGVLAGGISSLVIAKRDSYSVVGALVLCAAPGVGGGLIRDLVLGRAPAMSRDGNLLGVVVMLVALGWLFYRLVLPRLSPTRQQAILEFDHARSPVLYFFNSAEAACFTVLGVLVAIEMRKEPLWLWGPVAAAFTCGGGSVLREIIRANPQIASLRGGMSFEVPLVWGLLLALFFTWYATQPPYALWVIQAALGATLLGVLLTRWVIVRLGLRGPML